MYVVRMNSSDLMVGLYLIIIDVIVEDNYVEIYMSWRTGLTCHVLGFIYS